MFQTTNQMMILFQLESSAVKHGETWRTLMICWASPPASLASPRSLVTTMANWLHGATANGPGDSWGDLGPYKCRGSLWDATKETSIYIYLHIYIWLAVRCCPVEARAFLRNAAC